MNLTTQLPDDFSRRSRFSNSNWNEDGVDDLILAGHDVYITRWEDVRRTYEQPFTRVINIPNPIGWTYSRDAVIQSAVQIARQDLLQSVPPGAYIDWSSMRISEMPSMDDLEMSLRLRVDVRVYVPYTHNCPHCGKSIYEQIEESNDENDYDPLEGFPW